MKIEPDMSDAMHRLVTSIISPRPIGWISSRSGAGVDNIAPFSYFNAVSTRPPAILFSATNLDDGKLKDTPSNVLETDEFVANLVTEDLAWQMYRSSERVSPDVDEFEYAGIEKIEADRVDAPRVANAKASMECTLYDSLEVFDHTVIIGEVELIHVDESTTTEGKIDMWKIDSVGRLGGPFYTDVRRAKPDAWIGEPTSREGNPDSY
jgi:flavin reductase (DIM6/NTAB) family NADH-FMN oxidoreductase RutF